MFKVANICIGMLAFSLAACSSPIEEASQSDSIPDDEASVIAQEAVSTQPEDLCDKLVGHWVPSAGPGYIRSITITKDGSVMLMQTEFASQGPLMPVTCVNGVIQRSVLEGGNVAYLESSDQIIQGQTFDRVR